MVKRKMFSGIKEFLRLKRKKKIKGFLDSMDQQFVYGWAWNPNKPEERLEVILYVDGKPVAEGVADQYREDLEKAGIGDGRHGFRIKLPEDLADGIRHKLEVYAKRKNKMIKLKNCLEKIFPFISSVKFPSNIQELYNIVEFAAIKKYTNETGIVVNTSDEIEEFLSGNFKVPIRIFKSEILNSLFYYELSKKFILNKNFDKAEAFLNMSKLVNPKFSLIEEFLGNINYELGNKEEAIKFYKLALNKESTEYVFLNLSKLFFERKQYKQAISVLIEGLKNFPHKTYLKEKIEEYLKQAWEDKIKSIYNSVLIIDNKKILNDFLDFVRFTYETLRYIYGFNENSIHKFYHYKTDRILIIAGSMDLPQCKRYRIDQKISQLKKVGIETLIIPFTETEKAIDYLDEYDIFLFYRIPITYDVVKLITFINGFNKISIYEIDDLVFDIENYPPSIESFGGYVDINLYKGLLFGALLMNSAIRFCQYGLASTQPLANKLGELVLTKKCFIHRNGIDQFNLISEPKLKDKKEEIIIFYGSGTLSHNQDFIELAIPALEKILEEHDNVKVQIVGYLKLPEKFLKRYSMKIQQIPFIENLEFYYFLLSNSDINLAVLFDRVFEGCKSELKWVEAACCGVPSVVSATENYKQVIRHGIDGFLAENSDEFYKFLKLLIENPQLRYEIAKNAQERVLNEYSLENLGKNFKDIINEIVSDKIPNLEIIKNEKKPKIAIVNVWFPPQEIGGGTIVAADNLRVLREKYSEKYEFVVFTTDYFTNNHKAYYKDSYMWNGIKCYRIKLPVKENLDWIYQDEIMKKKFNEFLENEKPNLIHFHAIQRITASAIEATLIKKIPYIITIHDAWWISDWMFLMDDEGNVYLEGFPDIFSDKPLPKGVTLSKSIERRIYLKKFLLQASFIYTVSDEFAQIYRKNGFKNIAVIKNGISEHIKWEKKDTSYTDKVVLGFSPAFALHKGYHIFEKALQKVKPKNIEVLLISPFLPENSIDFRFVANVPVIMRGPYQRERMPEFYKKIDILFHPSVGPESYGLSIREAMACGCWVVVSDRVGDLESLKEREGVILVKPEIEDLVEVIKMIDENPEKFKQAMEHENIRTVSEQVEELVKVYDNILSIRG